MPVAMAVTAATVTAAGHVQQGNAAAGAAKYSAGIELNNAEIARRNAEFAGQKGAAAVEKESMATRAKIGGIIAEQGASGVDIGGESARNVRASAAEIGALNALNIRSAAAREAYGYQVEAAGHTAQARLNKMEAKQAKIAGWTKATTTMLSAGADKDTGWESWGKSKSLNSDILWEPEGQSLASDKGILWDQ